MSNSSRKLNANKLLYIFVMLSFLIPVVFLILRMAFGKVPVNEAGYHSTADYVLMIVQCSFGVIAIHIPMFLSKKFHFEIPLELYGLYIIFLYCAIFLGEVRSFYYVIPYWDSILHAFSSLMLGFFGYMVITILNRSEKIMVHLSPLFSAIFAFCFALTIGCMWEIYEYSFDHLLGLNMQKFMTADGEILSGHDALTDTMKDLIIDGIGALVSSFLGFLAIKKNKKWIYPKLTN